MTTPNYNFKVAFFSVAAQTPLHVGAGGENFWIIDNLVQRDPTSNLPCIYASSMKGALREYMRDYLNKDYYTLFKIFGNDKSDTDDTQNQSTMEQFAEEAKQDKSKWAKLQVPGEFRFLQADLVSIPTLQEGHIEYVITCEWLKVNFDNKLALFNHTIAGGEKDKVFQVNETIDNLAFCEKVDDYHLPVIARNHLEDGTSTNLWYEQVLPAKTKLVFAVLYETEDLFQTFKKAVESNPIQIGANASVGYGFCSVKQIETQFKTVAP